MTPDEEGKMSPDERLALAANEVNDRLAKAASEAPGCKHEWTGQGEQPAKFWCRCGTLVYRSYADFCDD